MNSFSYKIEELIAEYPEKRGVAFLVSDDRRVTAKESFNAFNENTQKYFKVRFEQWVEKKMNGKQT